MHYTEDGEKSVSSKKNKPSNEIPLEEKHKENMISFKTN